MSTDDWLLPLVVNEVRPLEGKECTAGGPVEWAVCQVLLWVRSRVTVMSHVYWKNLRITPLSPLSLSLSLSLSPSPSLPPFLPPFLPSFLPRSLPFFLPRSLPSSLPSSLSRNEVSDRLAVHHCSIAQSADQFPSNKFHYIISNPPYIPTPSIENLQLEVAQ